MEGKREIEGEMLAGEIGKLSGTAWLGRLPRRALEICRGPITLSQSDALAVHSRQSSSPAGLRCRHRLATGVARGSGSGGEGEGEKRRERGEVRVGARRDTKGASSWARIQPARGFACGGIPVLALCSRLCDPLPSQPTRVAPTSPFLLPRPPPSALSPPPTAAPMTPSRSLPLPRPCLQQPFSHQSHITPPPQPSQHSRPIQSFSLRHFRSFLIWPSRPATPSPSGNPPASQSTTIQLPGLRASRVHHLAPE